MPLQTVGPLLTAANKATFDDLVNGQANQAGVALQLESGRVQYFSPEAIMALKKMGLQLPQILKQNPGLKDDFFQQPRAAGLFIYGADRPYTLLNLEVDHLCRLNKPDCQGASVSHVAPSIARMRKKAIKRAISDPGFEQRYTYSYTWNPLGGYHYSDWLQHLEPETYQLRYNCSAIFIEECEEVLVRVYDNTVSQNELFSRISAEIASAQALQAS